MFRFGLPVFLLVIQGILFTVTWRHLQRHYPGRRWLKTLIVILFLVFNSMVLLSALFRVRFFDIHGWVLYGVVFPFFIWHIATLFIGLVLLIVYLVRLPFRAGLSLVRLVPPARERIDRWHTTSGFQTFDASRRVFLRRSAYTLAALSFGGTAYGAFTGRSNEELNTAEFIIDGLPSALDGFSIALVSDIHSGAFMGREEMSRYVSLLNGMQTDIIVVTGDFVNGLTQEVYPFAEAFSDLHAPYGVYGSTGNHEYYAQDPELVIREVNDSGVRILSNERITIEKNGASFALIGLDDTGNSTRAIEKLETATKNLPAELPRVLLCHRPYFFPHFAEHGINLVLSGHTHGGQIRLAQFGDTVITPAALASPYVWGPYHHKNAAMYVSRGIGTVGVPFRINCPPELTRIVLRSPERRSNLIDRQ